MNKTLWWFIPLVCLMTMEFRIDLGFFSFAIVEPFVVLSAGLVLIPKLLRREPLQWRNPFLLLFVGITFWAILIRPFSPDWKHGLSDVRDWIIPTLFLFTILNTKDTPPYHLLTGFIAVLLLNSTLGLYQHFTDSFRPFANASTGFKTTIDGSEHADFALGLFDAPNGFGLYLAAATPFLWAWLRTSNNLWGRFRYLLLFLPLAALYYSYARTSMLVFGVVIVLIILERLIRPTPLFIQVTTWFLTIAGLIAVIGLNLLPHFPLRTIWWRIALWEISGITLSNYPSIWLVGNGIDRLIPISFYPQPHNLFIFMVLEYGAIGLIFTFAVLIWLVNTGLRARTQGHFTNFPALAPMWIGVFGLFLIALTETIWIGVNTRLLFVTLIGMYSLYMAEANPALVRLPHFRLPRSAVRLTNPREQHS